MKTFFSFFLLIMLMPVQAARAEILLIPPGEPMLAGRVATLTVYLNNPSAEPFEFVVPDSMHAELASVTEHRRLQAVAMGHEAGERVQVAAMSFVTLKFAVVLPDTLSGTVSLRMIEPNTNSIMFAVQPAEVVSATPSSVKAAKAAVASKDIDVELTTDRELMRRHISAYEPVYFTIGLRDGANARFQFSFKYLILGQNTNDPKWYRSIYLGYTQTSLWDLQAPSKPFYDSSYKPTVFFYREAFKVKPAWLSRFGLQTGVQHESNGKGADQSRSLNTAYITPIAVWDLSGPWRLYFAPRFIAYADKSENTDLARYRGNIEYVLRVGTDKGFQAAGLFRKGNSSGYGSSELQLTWPMRLLPGFSRNAGGYFQLQYFNGWGESLLDYNRRRTDQLRFGYSLTR